MDAARGDPAGSPDRGLTHVALLVSDLERSVDFYARYAGMRVVHRRDDPVLGKPVAWLSDLTRPFVIVLFQFDRIDGRLEGFAHLGLAVSTRAEVDRLVDQARREGRAVLGPVDAGHPAGYWAFVRDPDGHNLELSHGQWVGLTIERVTHRERPPEAAAS